MRNHLVFGVLLLLLALPAVGAERTFDFGEVQEQQAPKGFRSTVTGKGKPGQWKVVLDEVAPLLAPLTAQAPVVSKRAVLAQLSQDLTDEHYPLLVFEEETFRDFTLTTRFKLVDGVAEQMAGVAFHIQDEKNYYYVRASALGNTFYFFKFVNGELIGPIGSKVPLAKGVWHEMSIECKGSQISCSLDGKVLIPQMQQDTFAKGKIGFWTKSDSVSYFADTKLVYTPLEVPAQTLVRQVAKKYPRLLGLKIYVPSPAQTGATRLVASKDEKELGQPGAKTEQEVIARNEAYYGKDKNRISIIMPLRDRNGDAIAAVRVVMKSFAGQTEANAIVRAAPIVKEMQVHIQSLQDLID
jgi:hypothetical protein